MKQQNEYTFMYFLLIYIVNVTYNEKSIFLSLIYLVFPTQRFWYINYNFWLMYPKKNIDK